MSALTRITAMASLALLAGITLTGCAAGSDDGSNDAEDQVSKLALQEHAEAGLAAAGDAKVAGVWEWHDNGYSVLVSQEGENEKGDFTNWDAYGFEPNGDSWELANHDALYDEDGPAETPERATCTALAETDAEVESCSQIDG